MKPYKINGISDQTKKADYKPSLIEKILKLLKIK